MKALPVVILFVCFNLVFSQNDSQYVEKFFQNHNGAFVLFDMTNGKYFRYNEKRCAERFLPASTFKIPNSLIGLETGIIPDENFIIKWA